MEVHPGVFVSNVATEEWQADPEIGGGAEEHVLFDTGTMRAGLSRFTKDADQTAAGLGAARHPGAPRSRR